MATTSVVLVAFCLLTGPQPARAAATGTPAGPLVEFSVEASQQAPNDQARATVFAEAAEASAGAAAGKVNAAIARALATAKAYPAIKTRSGNTWTQPNYSKGGKTIDSWRTRSELVLESGDMTALADLLGKLQSTLGVAQISMQPAPETQKQAEAKATTEALLAFKEKARNLTATLGRQYRIVHLAIGGGARPPAYPLMARAMAMTAEAPMPLEAGESTVSVNVSGQIEVTD
ncbi:MAG: SIMPL domain-containing protein [Proteobacteria bacterium]|nr:SIMPL domain-containing protein [Pseudomonadota bacterium]